jgi:hypothetical protein
MPAEEEKRVDPSIVWEELVFNYEDERLLVYEKVQDGRAIILILMFYLCCSIQVSFNTVNANWSHSYGTFVFFVSQESHQHRHYCAQEWMILPWICLIIILLIILSLLCSMQALFSAVNTTNGGDKYCLRRHRFFIISFSTRMTDFLAMNTYRTVDSSFECSCSISSA